jgi:nucleotidyltransferase substrate binding protein (TIGR01987 family)
MVISFQPFEDALATLKETLTEMTDAMHGNRLKIMLRDSAIQRFEYTYNLAIISLRRVLEEDGKPVDEFLFRDILRMGKERGLIDDDMQWITFRNMRNITSHAYDEEKAVNIYEKLPFFMKAAEQLLQK